VVRARHPISKVKLSRPRFGESLTMTNREPTPPDAALVAIDVSKLKNDVLIEIPGKMRFQRIDLFIGKCFTSSHNFDQGSLNRQRIRRLITRYPN